MTDGPNDNLQYVDLGNWMGDTCFVRVDSYDQGIERVAGGGEGGGGSFHDTGNGYES